MLQATENELGAKTSVGDRKVKTHYDFQTSSKSISSLLFDLMPGTKFPQICGYSCIGTNVQEMLAKKRKQNFHCFNVLKRRNSMEKILFLPYLNYVFRDD